MPAQSISQTPDPLNITVRQFQEWAIGFSYQDADGNPISLEGYVPLLQFRTSALARTTVLSLTDGDGLIFNPDTLPQVQVSAGIACAPGKYEWDLRLTPANTNDSIFLGLGTVVVEAEVSR